MGVQNLPNTGNKFTGSRIFIPGIGISTYKVQKNEEISIRDNQYAGYINPSVTPTKSITPTPTITPTITPTFTPSPTVTPTLSPVAPEIVTFNANSVNFASLRLTSNQNGYIDWGDSSTTNLSGGITTVYPHTYGTSYTGDINIYHYGPIISIGTSANTSPCTTSTLELNTSQLTGLTSLTTILMECGRLLGSFSDLSSFTTLTNVTVYNDFTTGSNLSDFINNSSLSVINLQNSTQISGNLSSINVLNSLTNIRIAGTNTVNGDLNNIPSTVTFCLISGNNTISGDVQNIQSSGVFIITGNNTITGDIANIPSNITNFNVGGYNTVYGDIATIPSQLSFFTVTEISAGGIITGLLDNVPMTNNNSITINTSNNTLSATTAGFPLCQQSCDVWLGGDITGDLSDLFSSGTDFPTNFSIDNTLMGATSNITYTPNFYPWQNLSINRLVLKFKNSMSSTIVDDLLIDLAFKGGTGVTWINPGKTLILRGTRTSASDPAVTDLQNKGVTVTLVA